MWLSRDERRLLRGYYGLIGDLHADESFRIDDLATLLTFWGYRRKIPTYQDHALPENPVVGHEVMRNAIRTLIQKRNRVKKANGLLVARNLIKVTPHNGDDGVVNISLTLDGFDLGRKYANWFEWSGHWFEAYRNHWLWLIFATIGGSLLVKLWERIWG